MRRLGLGAGLGLALLLGTSGAACGLTMSGWVQDSAGNRLPHIRVQIIDQNTGGDSVLATLYTDASGNYSAVLPEQSWWNPPPPATPDPPDLYIAVSWRFELLPAAFYGSQIVLRSTETAQGAPAVPFSRKTSAPATDHDPAQDLTGHFVAMDQALPKAGLLRLHLNEALDYYKDNRGSVPWTLNGDVTVILRTWTSASQAADTTAADLLFLATADIDGSAGPNGQGFVTDIYHEMGHIVHYRFGNRYPPVDPNLIAKHNLLAETDPHVALAEGWPSYVAAQTQRVYPQPGESKYLDYEDPSRTLWRGEEPARTGRDGSAFESGENVEGALGGVWTQLHASGGFEPSFAVFFYDQPQHILDFLQRYPARAARAGGGSAAALAWAAAQDHGIPFSRARFTPEPFPGDDPPDQGPPEDGNVKEIAGKLFLRGKVKAGVEALAPADLGVTATLGLGQVGLAFKPAAAGTGQEAAAFTQLLPFAPFAGSPYEIDTTLFGGTRGEGEWDLALVGENQDSHRDSLRPSWKGDGNAAVDSDEKYLKTVGAWYDKDRNPVTEDDGKVVVDNTAPKVEGFKPQ